jgi:steroid delta-isomerase
MSENDALAAMLGAQKGSLSPEQLRTTMEAYLESWRRDDPDARVALFTAEPVIEDPVGTPAYRGQAAVREFWKHAAWPGVTFGAELHKFIACGREALAHFTITLTGGGRPPMNIEVHETVKFEADGRISELRAYWNQGNVSVGS